MQVIRNKGGYVIRVSNVEWRVLQHIHDEGYMGVSEGYDEGASGLAGAEKSIFTQIYNMTRPWMQGTEDRRK